MLTTEFLQSKAEGFAQKFKKEGISISVFQSGPDAAGIRLFVIQVPDCDVLYTTSKKFKKWKDGLETECSPYIDDAFVLVTDTYDLDASFKKIY